MNQRTAVKLTTAASAFAAVAPLQLVVIDYKKYLTN